jgi:hypothetical protein
MPAQFGSISSGTMRAEDLIPAFADCLAGLISEQPVHLQNKQHLELVAEANAIEDFASADDTLADLFAALEEYAPPYGYFGAHEGDGACYGFWLSEDAIQYSFDGLRVDDTSEVPADYSGEVLHVNDHGNMTLYAAENGKLTEVWGLV